MVCYLSLASACPQNNILNSYITISEKVGFVAFRKIYSGTIKANKTPNHLLIVSSKMLFFFFLYMFLSPYIGHNLSISANKQMY